jgi:uncharacterized protein YegL
MKQNYTHIVLLLDRSGSMQLIKEDMEGGIKTFMDAQKLETGDCTVTVAQFDSVYEVLQQRVPISKIKDIKISPRGSTALLDSMGRLINEVGVDLASMNEDERPDRILFITVTDGEENSSHEFTNEMLKNLIKEQEDKYAWNFTYIGANQDAFANAEKFGGKMSNSMNYIASKDGIDKMWTKVSNATSRYRSVSNFNINSDSFQYNEDEQKDQ